MRLRGPVHIDIRGRSCVRRVLVAALVGTASPWSTACGPPAVDGPHTRTTETDPTGVAGTSVSTTGQDETTDSTASGVSTGAFETAGHGSTGDAGTSGGAVQFECDLWDQDCPEGLKCMPVSLSSGGKTAAFDATRCVDVSPDAMPAGSLCQVEGPPFGGQDNCSAGARCIWVQESGVGLCVDLCSGSADAPTCPGGTICSIDDDVLSMFCPWGCERPADCPGPFVCNSGAICAPA